MKRLLLTLLLPIACEQEVSPARGTVELVDITSRTGLVFNDNVRKAPAEGEE